MRKVVSQVREIRFQRFEIAVERCPEKNLKLCPVDLVTVNLLVIESYAAEDTFWCKDFLALRAQSSIGGQCTVFGQPRADGAFWDVLVKASSQNLLGLCCGMTEVES